MNIQANGTHDSCQQEQLQQQPQQVCSPLLYLPSNSTHSPELMLQELIIWNRTGIERIVNSTGIEDFEYDTQRFNDGITCFHNAFQLTKPCNVGFATSTVSRQQSKPTPTATGQVPRTANSCAAVNHYSIGLADPVRLPRSSQHNVPQVNHTIDYIFKRPFTISLTDHEVVTSSSSCPAAIPSAVVVFNLAMTYHVLSVSEQKTRLRLKQCIKLYQCCWKLLTAELKSMTSQTGPTAPPTPKLSPIVELLVLAIINNMALAHHELAEYKKSYQFSLRLHDMLSATADPSPKEEAPEEDCMDRNADTMTVHYTEDTVMVDGVDSSKQEVSTMDLINEERHNLVMNSFVFSNPTVAAPTA